VEKDFHERRRKGEEKRVSSVDGEKKKKEEMEGNPIRELDAGERKQEEYEFYQLPERKAD